MTGGPPVRGTKLKAWRIPPVWKTLLGNTFEVPEGSTVLQNQEKMIRATQAVLTAMADDVRIGLLETVGVKSFMSLDGDRCSMILELPAGTDTKHIAEAIYAENADAWCDEKGQVNLGISPWYSTKDVDQTVLCAIKIVHVLLGMHAENDPPPKTFKQKLLSSIMDVLNAQNEAKKTKN